MDNDYGNYIDYNYQYQTVTTSTTAEPSSGLLAGIGIGFLLIWLAIVILMGVSMWKLYSKAGRPGWACIVPFYSTIVLLQIVGRPWWWLFLFIIPIVGIVVMIVVANDIAKAFGKGVAWTLGLVFLPIIFLPMLAFGSAQYITPPVRNS